MLHSVEGMTSSSGYIFKTRADEFVNKQGKKIFCYYWEPSEKPRALVLISHGFTEHTMEYEDLALELVRRRFFVFGHDHVGHGKSGGTRAHMNSHRHLVDDTLYHVELVKKKFPDLPLFLCGHSLGGSTSILCSLEKPKEISGMVLIAPAILPNPHTATFLKVSFAKLINRIIPQFPLIYTNVSPSCRSESNIAKFKKDPLRHKGFFTARATVCILDAGQECYQKKELIEVPYLLLHGDKDKVCNISGSEAMHQHSSSKDRTLKVYPNGYHSLLQEPDGMSEDVQKSVIDWLEQRT